MIDKFTEKQYASSLYFSGSKKMTVNKQKQTGKMNERNAGKFQRTR